MNPGQGRVRERGIACDQGRRFDSSIPKPEHAKLAETRGQLRRNYFDALINTWGSFGRGGFHYNSYLRPAMPVIPVHVFCQ
jgi:hypothetical protein